MARALEARRAEAVERAARSGRWAEIMFKALSKRVAVRWQFVSFRGKGGGEWRGIVDVLAIRKNGEEPTDAELKRGDLFDVILVQLKGGDARRPDGSEIGRLRKVGQRYHARAIVLFEWKKGDWCRFRKLGADCEWHPTNGEELFGRRGNGRSGRTA